MTAPVPETGPNLDVSNPGYWPNQGYWREYGVALLPLALGGVLPGWATLLLCLLFAAGVRFVRWREARLLVGLLVIGLAVLPEINTLVGVAQAVAGPALGALGLRYVGWLLGWGLVYWSALFLEGGQRRGLLTLLVAGLLAPQPLLLLALAGGAMMRPDIAQRFLSRVREPSPQEIRARRQARGWLAAAVLAAVVLGTLLPRAVPQVTPPALPTETRPLPKQPAVPPKQRVDGQRVDGKAKPAPVRQVNRSITEQLGLSPPPFELLNTLVLLNVLTIFIFLFWNGRAWRMGRKFSVLDILMVAGLLLTLLLSVLLSLGGSGEPGALPLQPASQAGQASGRLSPLSAEEIQRAKRDNILSWVLFVVQFGVLTAALWLLWKNRPRLERTLTRSPAEENQTQQPEGQPPALHRVRLAYLQAETALSGAGYGRKSSETPLGYAARMAEIHPPLTAALGQLTQIYSPVRYGGHAPEAHVSEECADAAEAAAAKIVNLTATLPRPEESPEEGPKDSSEDSSEEDLRHGG